MFYVYILKSLKDDNIYIGYSSDLRKRMVAHNQGKSFSTSFRLPLKLVYYEAFLSEKDAREREKKLKHYGRTIRHLKERIKNSLF
jgi:putative endonuclease